MENLENQKNYSNEDIDRLNNLINSQNDEIEQLTYKLNDLRRLLYNQLSDIKEISNDNKSINEEIEFLKNENVKLNDSVSEEFELLKNENIKLNDSVSEEFELLKNENIKLNDSVSEEFELLKNENIKLNDSVSEEFELLKNENAQLNDSVSEEFELLRNENKELRAQFKENDELNQKILDSYKENFKFLFYCYDLQPKPLLKNIWDICQEVLDFVVNVCEKHDIGYWLEAGSLLGAMRHGGFLPWDDDIDMSMMRSDYHRFQEVFDIELKNHNLEKKIKWRRLKHKKNVLYFLQISYGGFAILDIFPYDYVANPQENMEELYFAEKSKFKSNIKNGKSYSEALEELYENLDLSLEKQDYVVSGVERSVRGRFYLQNTDKMFPPSKVTFRGKEYCGLKDNDLHLTKQYGDWRELPKVLDRHNRIYKLRERPEINEFLVEKVNILHEINEKFNE